MGEYSVFVIEEAWVDSMENDLGKAFGYSPIGFRQTRESAESFCLGGGTIEGCWVNASKGAPRYRFYELKELPYA